MPSTPDRLSGFVSSWFFAPYLGSADLDLFKRLIHTDVDYQVVQVRRESADPRVLDVVAKARFHRTEVPLPGGPRTRASRDVFHQAVLERFASCADRVHFILSHSNEVPSHRAAWAIKQANPRLPWVAYFGDVVRHNPYVRYMREYPLFEEDCKTEYDTLTTADLVICNNDFQRKLMVDVCPQAAPRLVTIPHCFEASWYSSPSHRPKGPLQFVHLGTLYPVKRSAGPFLDAVDLLLDVYPALRNRFRLVFVGDERPDDDLRRQSKMRHPEHVEFRPSVPYLESLRLMQNADALVVIDGVFDERELAASPYLPGKLADYLGAHKPIIASTMRQGPTAEILQQRGEPWSDADPERLAFVLKRHIDGRVQSSHHQTPLYRAEVIGAAMELCFRAAIVGHSGVAELPRLLKRLFSMVREALP